MLFRTAKKFLRHTGPGLTVKYRSVTSSLLSDSDINQSKKKDPAPYFFDGEIQQLLTQLTRGQVEIALRERKDGKRREAPIYKFMTDEELEAARKAAHSKAMKVMQMPPVVKQRSPIYKILETDPALQGHDSSNYVFTDISFGIKDKDRVISVREPNGRLRLANWDERDRMKCVYFGVEGREMKIPAMFRHKKLQMLLEQKEYVFVLDRACLQFEPDDPSYQRIVTKVYNFVNDKKDFEQLRSTRHFGPMVFYLVWNNIMDNLIIDVLETGKIDEAASIIRLFNKIHSSAIEQHETFKNIQDDVEYIECYCKHYTDNGKMIINILRNHLNATKNHKRLTE